jgi:hypothetical protein
LVKFAKRRSKVGCYIINELRYEAASRKSMRALWKFRTDLELFGSHIDVKTGEWILSECSIGGGVDSYFEYLLKVHVAFSNEDAFTTEQAASCRA